MTTKLKDDTALEYSNYKHQHYNYINTDNTPPLYAINIDKKKIRLFSRMRMGHTISTYQHILHSCSLLSHRHNTFLNKNSLNILKTPSKTNIEAIFNLKR